MNNRERKTLVKECIKQYFNEDKEVLIDVNCMQITCIPYYIYNLIFFGNKIVFLNEDIGDMKKIAKQKTVSTRESIKKQNSGIVLKTIEKDRQEGKNSFKVIALLTSEKLNQVYQFLTKNMKGVYCTSNRNDFENLLERGVPSRKLFLMNEGMKEADPFANKDTQFQTIGALQIENGRMYIEDKGKSTIKVYDSRGIEKEGKKKEVKIRDMVLICSKKDDGTKSFILYEIVSFHTKNHSLKIIWTDVKVGQKSNKYIERQPYMYKRIIEENI